MVRCAHLAQQAFDALDLLAQVGALRPFGIVMDATGAIHLRVPCLDPAPTGLLEAVDAQLDAESDALIRGRVDAVDLRSGGDAHHAVRVVLRRRGRETLTAYQMFAMVDGEPDARAWWVDGLPEEEPTL